MQDSIALSMTAGGGGGGDDDDNDNDDDDDDYDDDELSLATSFYQSVRRSGSCLHLFRSSFLRSISSWYLHSKCKANITTALR